MTWLGHCVVNIRTVLRSLPSAGQLMLISDLRDFLDREERGIRRRNYAAQVCTRGLMTNELPITLTRTR